MNMIERIKRVVRATGGEAYRAGPGTKKVPRSKNRVRRQVRPIHHFVRPVRETAAQERRKPETEDEPPEPPVS